MSVIDELKGYFKEKGIKQTEIATATGWKTSFVSELLGGKRTIGEETAVKLNRVYGFDTHWLLTGEGTMLRTESSPPSSAEQNVELSKKGVLMVPVMNLDARGGLLANQETDVAEYVQGYMPFNDDIAKQGDFAMMVHGDSMYPRYPSGSYILLRPVEMWREYLELSVPYVLELADGRRVAKIVTKGSDKEHFTLKSVNPDFEDTEVAISFVSRVFQVVMMLKKEIV